MFPGGAMNFSCRGPLATRRVRIEPEAWGRKSPFGLRSRFCGSSRLGRFKTELWAVRHQVIRGTRPFASHGSLNQRALTRRVAMLGDGSDYDLSASLFLTEYSISSAVVWIFNIFIALYL